MRSKWPVLLLAVALFASNGWWLLTTLDAAVDAKYSDSELYLRSLQACDALAVLNQLAEDLPPETVIAAARGALNDSGFTKDSVHVVGSLHFPLSVTQDTATAVLENVVCLEPLR